MDCGASYFGAFLDNSKSTITNRNCLYSNRIEWIFLGIEPTTKNSTSMTCVVAHDNKLSWQWKKNKTVNHLPLKVFREVSRKKRFQVGCIPRFLGSAENPPGNEKSIAGNCSFLIQLSSMIQSYFPAINLHFQGISHCHVWLSEGKTWLRRL